jgi:putative peptide zinc metalloprotease protein
MVKPVSKSLPNAASKNAGLCLRPDLITQQLSSRNDGCWVIKDPISNEFHFFTDLEMKILRCLDGQSLSAVMQTCSHLLRNQYLPTEGLIAFLAELQQRGLLKSAKEERIPLRLGDLVSPLAIRLPGFNPEAFLNFLYAFLFWIFHPVSLAVAGCIMVFSVAKLLFQSDRFFLELPQATSWLTTDNAWTLLLVIGITKVIHELAHALTCRHFGGRCTEMGLLFLIFVPCLYCDVSDTWLEPRRWARIAVSAAGICAELFLASCAALIWSMTSAGTLHTICFTIMLVCSIQTLIFNANPLMRYDGYFILSDLWQVPNLASEAQQYLAKSLKSGFLGTPPSPRKPLAAPGWLLITYGLASFLYQLVILGAIVAGIYRFFHEARLEIFGLVLIVGVLASLFARWKISLRRLGLSRMEKRYLQPERVFAKSLALLGGFLILILYPWPHSIRVPYTVEAVDAKKVHTLLAGELVKAIPEGSEVQQGDWLATLSNSELEREINLLRAEEATLNSRLDQALNRRGSSQDVSSQIPTIRSAIESVHRRRELREKELSRLNIYSPIQGTVLAPRYVSDSRATDRNKAVGWKGTPLDAENVGCYLSAGTEVCEIGLSFRRKIILMVFQQDVELIRLGQRVRVFSNSHTHPFLPGAVHSIEASPVAELPAELIVSGTIPVDTVGTQPSKPLTPVYRVTVELDDDRVDGLPVRSVGTARIQLEHCSIARRVHRFVSHVSIE